MVRANKDLSHSEIVSYNTVSAVLVELNNKLPCQFIEMIKLSITNIITHQHKHSARLYPGGDCFYMWRFYEVRIIVLFFGIGVDNDVDIRFSQILERGRFCQSRSLCAQVSEKFSPKKETTVGQLLPLVVIRSKSARRILFHLAIEVIIQHDSLSSCC